LKNYRDDELERLRLKILDAVRFSKQFWMTYREETFGIASILNLIYKKSFLEVLFFTNKDVLEKGVPLLKIYTPIEEELDFNEILIEPDFDDDGLVSPRKIIGRMRKLIRREFQKHLKILEEEVNLIEERYENYPINNNPYYREIRVFFPDFVLNLNINFEKYPLIPSLSFSKALSKIISEKSFIDNELIKNWDQLNSPHIYEVIEKICELVAYKLRISRLSPNSQYLELKNVSIMENLKHISFKIHRGKSIGIIFKEEVSGNIDFRMVLLKLFEAISGSDTNFSGNIDLFGKNTLLLSKNEKEKIFILPQAYNSRIATMKIKKGIKEGIKVEDILNQRKAALDELLKRAGITPKIDEVMGEFFIGTPKRIRSKRAYIRNALEVTGLINKKSKKFNKLTPLEFLMFSIGRALLQAPTIIMFLIPFDILSRLDFEKFNKYMNKVKETFHVILIFHGPEGIISQCDQILTIGEEMTSIGSLKQLIGDLPQSGEIFTIELTDPDEMLIKKLYESEQIATIIEERKNEKYKLFIKEDSNRMILKLTELFGPHLYSFKRFKASIGDYLEYFEEK